MVHAVINEPLNKSGRATMRIKIVKCEARNAVNIGNINKFRNDAVDDFKLIDAEHDLFRGFLNSHTDLLGKKSCYYKFHK